MLTMGARLAGQRLRVERIEALGCDGRQGRRLLDVMKDTLKLMVEHRDEIASAIQRGPIQTETLPRRR